MPYHKKPDSLRAYLIGTTHFMCYYPLVTLQDKGINDKLGTEGPNSPQFVQWLIIFSSLRQVSPMLVKAVALFWLLISLKCHALARINKLSTFNFFN
jgi:hypothetical protein